MELKVWRRGQPDPRPDGLRQLDAYLDRLGLGHGTLVVFDGRQSAPVASRAGRFSTADTPSGRSVAPLPA